MKKISALLDSKYLYKCIYILALVMVIIFIMLYYFDINYTKQINLDNINVVNEDDFVVKIGFFEVKNNVMQVYRVRTWWFRNNHTIWYILCTKK